MTIFMRRAFEVARKGRLKAAPNPLVGCVIEQDGKVIAEGWHKEFGGAHAEQHAISKVPKSFFDSAGRFKEDTTVHVTLQPCNVFGYTPPCSNLLIEAGVKKVCIAMLDPSLKNSPSGLSQLRDAGIEVVEEDDSIKKMAQWQNRGFLAKVLRGTPWVTLKLAASLDGKTALASGESQWISSEASRADVQHLRACSCVVLTGSGTVLEDDPSLRTRLPQVAEWLVDGDRSALEEFDAPQLSEETLSRHPVRAIVDSTFRVPLDAGILGPEQGPALLFVGDRHAGKVGKEAVSIDSQKAKVEVLPNASEGGIDLTAVMQYFGQQKYNYILAETGAKLAANLLNEELVDEVLIYQSGKILGQQARPLLAIDSPPTLDFVNDGLECVQASVVGADVRHRWVSKSARTSSIIGRASELKELTKDSSHDWRNIGNY